MHNLARRMGSLETFFCCPAQKINKTIALMVLYHGGEAEWMRGISRFENLPRVSITPLPHKLSIILIRDREIAERARWIIENLHKQWRLSLDGFEFEDENEAIHYKLRFN